jgi:hypothetical protein
VTEMSNSAIASGTGGPKSRRTLPHSLRLTLVGVASVLALAGCTGTAISPSAQPSAPASAGQTALASPTASLAPSGSTTAIPTAQPPLTFVATGSMHTARIYGTATLLQSGKVLMAGGSDARGSGGSVFASAELYDPATGNFTETGSMTVGRANHTATLLTDGRVLIAGGWLCTDKTCAHVDAAASAELYDPATGTFSPTGSMTTPRAQGRAILLPDSRVLLTQGDGPNQMAELYDPKTGRFVRTGQEIRFDDPTAVLLQNGKVLVTGGDLHGPLEGALYDEASGKFTKISFALAPGAAPTTQYSGEAIERTWPDPVTVLKDGRVLLFEGGYLETYDPATGACAAAGFISPSGQWIVPTATLLPDGHVLFVGGVFESADFAETTPTSAVLYDPVGGSQMLIQLKSGRSGSTSTLLADGSVLIAGGYDSHGKFLSSAELLKP